MQRIIALGLVTGMLTACGINPATQLTGTKENKKGEKSAGKTDKPTGKKQGGAGFSLSLPEDVKEKASGKTVEADVDMKGEFQESFLSRRIKFTCDGKEMGTEKFADVEGKKLKGILELALTSTKYLGLETKVVKKEAQPEENFPAPEKSDDEAAWGEPASPEPLPEEAWEGDVEWGSVSYGGEGGSYSSIESTGESIMIPYTCEGNMNVLIQDLDGDEFEIYATLYDSEGISMYQGNSGVFGRDVNGIELSMHKIVEGAVDVHVVFEDGDKFGETTDAKADLPESTEAEPADAEVAPQVKKSSN